jgi:hypothetical protein
MSNKWNEYQYVMKIERVSSKTIKIYRTTFDTIIQFEDSQECLDRFIELENEHKEALSFG